MPKVKKSYTHNQNSPYTFVRQETQIFEDSMYDVSLASSSACEYHPISSLSDRNAPLEFSILANDTQYIDLNQTKLYIRARILDPKGESVKENTIVLPVNNMLNSMFSQCSIYLNENLITPSTNMYAYRSYLETLLGYSKEYKKSQAQCALYYKEKKPSNLDVAIDDGFKYRYELSKESQPFEMIGEN
jgi:hypothetical protein